MKKKIFISFLLLTILLSISLILADTEISTPSSTSFSLSSYISHLINPSTFSVIGTTRRCDSTATDVITVNSGTSKAISGLIKNCGSGSALIDVFLNNYGFPWMEFSSDEAVPSSIKCTASSCIFEVYCCDTPEPFSQSDCSTGNFKTINCNYNSAAGGYACKSDNGLVENDIPYNYPSYNYCSSSNPLITCYFSDGTTCQAVAQTDCNANGGLYAGHKLYNNLSECQTSSTTCISGAIKSCTGGTQTCIMGEWGSCTSLSTTCKSTSQSCTQDSQCCSGLTCQNFGCYGQPVCGDNICQSTETKTSCSVDCGTEPICGDGKCDSGETTGATYACSKDCNSSNSLNNVKTLTIQEFYSISDDEFANNLRGCNLDMDCNSIEGYNSTCLKQGTIYSQYQKRLFNYYKSQCEFTSIIKLVDFSTKFFLGVDFCDVGAGADVWISNHSKGAGICIAKSNSWYGGIWEQILIMIGSLGLPTQYVMMIAIAVIILLIFVGVSFLK